MFETTYQMLDDILRRAGAGCDASECHGVLVGLACIREGESAGTWLDQITGDLDPADVNVAECREGLLRLYGSCCSELDADHFEFTPLLPEDTSELSVRAAALGRWCQGFLFGLGLGGLPDFGSLPGDVPEIIRDLSEITRAGFDEQQDEEESEIAYAEIVEFVRVSVRLVHEELNPVQETRDSAPTLH